MENAGTLPSGRGLRRRALPLAFGLLVALFPAPARAQLEMQLTPWVGYLSSASFLDSATNDVLSIDDSVGFGFVLDLLESPGAYYELIYSFQRTELGGDDTSGQDIRLDLDVHYIHVGGLYEFEGEHVRPFVAAGFGATALVPSGDRESSTNFSLSIGGGLKVPISENAVLRLEGKGYLTILSDNTEIFCISSGGSGSCAAAVDGDSLGQLAVMAGISFRL